MVTKVFSTIRQRVWEAGQSLAGDGMLLRLRNASIALVGVVAAVGLGLTLFISQLGFPSVFSGPIPDSPERSGAVHNAVALSHDSAAAVPSSSRPRRVAAASPNRHPSRHGGGDGGRRGSRKLAVAPGTQSDPVAQHPASTAPVSGPAPQTAEPSPPAPTPPVAASPPTSGAGGQPKGSTDVKTVSNAAATVKAANDGTGKSATSPATTAGDKNGGRTTSTTAKSTASPSEKASKDQSIAASTPPAPATPPAASPEKEASPPANPAAAKEAADSGR